MESLPCALLKGSSGCWGEESSGSQRPPRDCSSAFPHHRLPLASRCLPSARAHRPDLSREAWLLDSDTSHDTAEASPAIWAQEPASSLGVPAEVTCIHTLFYSVPSLGCGGTNPVAPGGLAWRWGV